MLGLAPFSRRQRTICSFPDTQAACSADPYLSHLALTVFESFSKVDNSDGYPCSAMKYRSLTSGLYFLALNCSNTFHQGRSRPCHVPCESILDFKKDSCDMPCFCACSAWLNIQ